MRYFSVCSGIEAATVAWNPLGWKAQGFSEIEKFPSAVLDYHYTDVKNFGDMTRLEEDEDYGTTEFDILVGGTPCQSFSVAGLRKGLDDERGQLIYAYHSILEQKRPSWMVWENVPGVLSSNGGRDFGAFLGGLAKCGYGFAFRILNAEYFGTPQRRRRVFVVGYLGDWRRAAAVLFERESLCRNFTKSRKKRKEIAGALKGCTYSGTNAEGAAVNHFIEWPAKKACTLDANFGEKCGLNNQHINQGAPLFVPTCIQGNMVRPNAGCNGKGWNQDNISYTLTSADRHAVQDNIGVRRLTPIECERLQGFPDNYTQIPYRNKTPEKCPDGPRYKALGNSMAVPVMRWIGERIQMVEYLTSKI